MRQRQLTSYEENVLQYIEQHPGLTPEDVVKAFGGEDVAQYAIQYLIWNLYVKQDMVTHAMVVRER